MDDFIFINNFLISRNIIFKILKFMFRLFFLSDISIKIYYLLCFPVYDTLFCGTELTIACQSIFILLLFFFTYIYIFKFFIFNILNSILFIEMTMVFFICLSVILNFSFLWSLCSAYFYIGLMLFFLIYTYLSLLLYIKFRQKFNFKDDIYLSYFIGIIYMISFLLLNIFLRIDYFGHIYIVKMITPVIK